VTSRRIDDKLVKGLQVEIAAEDGAHGLGFGIVDDELIWASQASRWASSELNSSARPRSVDLRV
jgi:hypothetical protein